MTTFNTKNQAKRKYFYIAGILVVLLVIVTLAFNSFRKSNKCDPNSDITNLSVTESNNEVKNEIRDYVTVSTNYGDVRGLKNKFNNVTINTFLGVPYASPPIGFLRFERTSPLQKWEGIRDAVQQPASCLQTDSPLVLSAFRFLNSSSSEDCLYLNIWAPHQEDQFLPVIVYIHGGAFAYGGVATEVLDGIALAAQQEVVVVTIQYRLGIFGFLGFKSQEPKGNMGLFDQREALKWIHSNINKFGGDQDLITVVGHGAGAVSTGLHMISPDSKSYFQRALLQGSSLMWHKELFSHTIEYSKRFAQEINCYKAPKIKECIKVVNVDKLLEVQMEILEDIPVAFAPIIPHAFVSTFPSESKEMFDFQIDFMLGINSEDDSLFLTTLRHSHEEDKEDKGEENKDEEDKGEDKEEEEDKEDKGEDKGEKDKETDSETDNSDKDDSDSEKSTTIATPIERQTSKPLLTVTTLPDTNVKSNETVDSLTVEHKNNSNDNNETMTTIEPNTEEKDDEDEEETKDEEKDESVTDSEDGNDNEEDRRRRRKRAIDEYNSKIICPLLEFSNAIVETNRSVYIYQLNEFSSYHDEVVFAFGYPLRHQNLYDNEEIKFTKYVMNNWAQFAKNGDLSEEAAQWKSYSKENPSYLKMSISSITSDKFNSQDCNQVNPQ